MAGSTTLNFFNQTPGPLGNDDNELVLSGTVSSAAGTRLNVLRYTLTIDDASTAGTHLVAPGVAGTVVRIIGGTENGPGTADETFTAQISGTPITNGVITIPQSTGGQQSIAVIPTAANILLATQILEIVVGGASAGAASGSVTFEVLPD